MIELARIELAHVENGCHRGIVGLAERRSRDGAGNEI
jgi:hypothetical protein